MNNLPRLLIVGHARHGKETVCQYLANNYGFRHTSSSNAALDHVIWPAIGYRYSSKAECFEDRMNHRALWFELIKFYNDQNMTELAEAVYAGYDIYDGMRSILEFEATVAKLDVIPIWVYASDRKPLEDSSSMQLYPELCQYAIDNNGTIDQMQHNADAVMAFLGVSPLVTR